MSLATDLRFDHPLNAIDVHKFPPAEIVDQPDFDALLQKRLDRLVALMRDHVPNYSAPLPSDPAYQVASVEAYEELLLRQQINDAGRQVMLAYASGANLDHLAALYRIERAVIDPGDADAVPPRPAVLESDDAFLRRVLLAPEALNTAGSRGSYIFHALSADPARVADAEITSPNPGEIVVTVLSLEGDGTPDQALLDTVAAALSADDVRPWGDFVQVQAATVVPYQVNATVKFLPGPDAGEALAQAQANWDAYTAPDNRRLGRDATISRITSLLFQPGMHSVSLDLAASVVVDGTEYAHATGFTLTNGGVDV